MLIKVGKKNILLKNCLTKKDRNHFRTFSQCCTWGKIYTITFNCERPRRQMAPVEVHENNDVTSENSTVANDNYTAPNLVKRRKDQQTSWEIETVRYLLSNICCNVSSWITNQIPVMILAETKYADQKNWRKTWNQRSWLRTLEGKVLHKKKCYDVPIP